MTARPRLISTSDGYRLTGGTARTGRRHTARWLGVPGTLSLHFAWTTPANARDPAAANGIVANTMVPSEQSHPPELGGVKRRLAKPRRELDPRSASGDDGTFPVDLTSRQRRFNRADVRCSPRWLTATMASHVVRDACRRPRRDIPRRAWPASGAGGRCDASRKPKCRRRSRGRHACSAIRATTTGPVFNSWCRPNRVLYRQRGAERDTAWSARWPLAASDLHWRGEQRALGARQ